MSHISSNPPKGSEDFPAAFSERPAAKKLSRPGWPEIVVGLIVIAAVAVGVAVLLGRLNPGPVVYGLALTALAGVAPLAGFAAAALLRIRSLNVLGVRRTTTRWLLVGVGAGVATFREPEHPLIWYAKGTALANLGHRGEAIDWLCRAWRTRDQLLDNGDLVANILEELGHSPEECE